MNVQKMLRFDIEELSALQLMLHDMKTINRRPSKDRVPDSPYNQVIPK